MVRAEEMFSGRESQEFKKTIEGASKLLGKVDAYLEGQPVKKAPARPPADVAKASSPAPSTVTQAAPEPPAQLDACAAHWRSGATAPGRLCKSPKPELPPKPYRS